jgi:hypothetical protein
MLEFQLFRLKALRQSQSGLFGAEASSAELSRAAIESRPERGGWRGFTWHLGNVEVLDESGLYFALGRTTRSTVAIFDRNRHSFVEQESESAPFTHVIVDVNIGLCAIAKKAELGDVTAIARQLERMLNDTEPAYGANVRFAIDEINDPEQFVEQIRAALAVKGFSYTFTRPNPWDMNEDFHKPMERLLVEADGQAGTTSIKGDDLDRGVVEELSRSAAASGNGARARILRPGDSRPVNRTLGGNAVVATTPNITEPTEKREALSIFRRLYQRIRHDTDG